MFDKDHIYIKVDEADLKLFIDKIEAEITNCNNLLNLYQNDRRIRLALEEHTKEQKKHYENLKSVLLNELEDYRTYKSLLEQQEAKRED